MLKIEGKTFMNIQEAVQWLLENNALPFQSTANYAPLTEIGLGTIVNPTPAKVRIGSLIFFADSKVSTVVGITETGFICSNEYNNLVDDIAYVTNVAINGSGHLITTLSDGQTIDAGIVKQVSGFSIDASQHLIVSFNDGTSTDLGAIFSGNINISGNITATGTIDGNKVTGNEIVEKMEGYSFTQASILNYTLQKIYVGAVKNGNKLTLVYAFNITKNTSTADNSGPIGTIYVPSSVGSKLYPTPVGDGTYVATGSVVAEDTDGTKTNLNFVVQKSGDTILSLYIGGIASLIQNKASFFRIECTFLLSDSL